MKIKLIDNLPTEEENEINNSLIAYFQNIASVFGGEAIVLIKLSESKLKLVGAGSTLENLSYTVEKQNEEKLYIG
jgi:lipid II:glycine glycyltransferase (peptidoglycan interpeptide bridge formation enzyme)